MRFCSSMVISAIFRFKLAPMPPPPPPLCKKTLNLYAILLTLIHKEETEVSGGSGHEVTGYREQGDDPSRRTGM